ncbi:LysR family transcriptional regulator [Cognatishimia sp. WU-CL00825]|uniref:LysR family transcriptional regulator n=1 Tax=Cognatishimia sp. WU-CL00825 TaxID=3127658 RepID=UPI0033653FAD
MDRIDLMKTYVAVADAKSFTAAAQRLGMTPQLVSKYVRTLEDRLGTQLFIRSTRNVRMTVTGETYLEKSRQFLDDFSELSAGLQQDHLDPKGSLRLTAPATYGELFLADIVAEFAITYPQVQVNMHLTDRHTSLNDEGFDVAIRIGKLEDSSLVAKKIAETDLVYCASPNYLSRNGKPATPDDLIGHDCIIDSNYRLGDRWMFSDPMDAKSEKTIQVTGRLKVNSAAAARRYALRNSGVMLCPYYVVAADIAEGALCPILQEYQPESLGIYAVYLENRHLSARVRVFVDFIVDALSS